MFPSRDVSGIVKVIGKMHLNNHLKDCVWRYAINYTTGGTRMDGEELERFWSVMNAIAGSGRQMGPGSHEDLYDYHFCFHTYMKVITICK